MIVWERNKYIIIGGAAILGVATYLIVQHFNRVSLGKQIIDEIDNGDKYGNYQDLQFSDAFNINFYKQAPGNKLYTMDSASSEAEKLYDAKSTLFAGLFNNDTEAVLSFFKNVSNWAKISQVAYRFNVLHDGKDLYEYLNSFMSSDDMQKIQDFIKTKDKI